MEQESCGTALPGEGNDDPVGTVTTPAAGTTNPIGLTTIEGLATDDLSGIDIVRVQVRRLDSPAEYSNGSEWVSNPR